MLRKQINGTTLRGTDGIDRTLNAVTLSEDEKKKIGELDFLQNDILLADGVKAVAANCDNQSSKLTIRFDRNGGTVTINGKDHVVNKDDVFTTSENVSSISISGNIVYIDASTFDTSKLSAFDMQHARQYYTSIDVSKWDTSNMINMDRLFLESLTPVLEVGKWTTSNVTDMSHMFYCCRFIRSLSLYTWDTSKVTDISGMFADCVKLENIDGIREWDVKNVVNAEYTFNGCKNLDYIPVEKWDLSNLVTADYMFSETAISGIEFHTETPNLKECTGMFSGCTQLFALDVSSINIDKCSDLNSMFYGCENLSELDLSSWNTRNINDISGMFCECTSLLYLNLSNWDTTNITDADDTFNACTNIETFHFTESFGRAVDLEEFDFSYMKNWIDDSVKTSLLSLYDRKTNGLKNLILKLSPETANVLGEDGKTTLETRGYTILITSHD